MSTPRDNSTNRSLNSSYTVPVVSDRLLTPTAASRAKRANPEGGESLPPSENGDSRLRRRTVSTEHINRLATPKLREVSLNGDGGAGPTARPTSSPGQGRTSGRVTPKSRSRQTSREGWTSTANPSPSTHSTSARTDPDGAATRPKITPKKTPDVKRSLAPAAKPSVTPTATKTRRSTPAKASPSVKPPPERKAPTPKPIAKSKPEKPKKKTVNAEKPAPDVQTDSMQSDKESPTVSEVLDETVAKLIDLELDERGRDATEPELVSGIASSNRSSSNPSPPVDSMDAQSHHGLQSKLDFNTLNLKKVMFNKTKTKN